MDYKEKVIALLNSQELSDEQKRKLEEIFPELKESEDERIRNKLINIVKECGCRYQLDMSDHIAWLEKQGEQKPAMIQWKGDNLKEVVDFTGIYKEGFEKWFHNSWEEYEKYVHEHNNIFKIFNKDGSHIEVPVGAWIVKTPDGYITASRYVFRQNPVWGEEDEKILNLIIARLHSHPNVEIEEYGKDYHWLKSLKDRVLSQWKPSNEQIKAVKEAACYSSVFSEKTIDNLISLSKQLKKLRKA